MEKFLTIPDLLPPQPTPISNISFSSFSFVRLSASLQRQSFFVMPFRGEIFSSYLTPFPSHCTLASVMCIHFPETCFSADPVLLIDPCYLQTLCTVALCGAGGQGKESTSIFLVAPHLLGSLRGPSGGRSMNQLCLVCWLRGAGRWAFWAPPVSSICPLSTRSGHHMRYDLDLDLLLGS